MGWECSISVGQLNLVDKLKIKEIKLCLGNDVAEQKATQNIALLISSYNPELSLKQVTLSMGAKDIDEVLKQVGKEKAMELIQNAKYIDTNRLELKQNKELKQTLSYNNEIQEDLKLSRGLELEQ
ncbi:hypothetical protein MIDIC_10003 [Alphaproteobacteria bacterium]